MINSAQAGRCQPFHLDAEMMRRLPAAAAAREVIEKEVGFQKNEVAIEGRGDVMNEKRTGDIQPAHT